MQYVFDSLTNDNFEFTSYNLNFEPCISILEKAMTVQQQFATIRTDISGHSIQDLVKQFGSPTYVYEAQTIRDRIEQLRQFDVIRYAQKANSNIAVLDLMRKNGVLVDAVSSGEVFRAVKAGFEYTGSPDPIVYTADIFDREALDLVADKGLHVNVGSPDMIEQYGKRVPGGEITIRINPGFGHGHSAKTNTGGESSKHGIWHEQLEECVALAAKHDVSVTGLHMHIGSGTDFEHLSQVCEAMAATARRVGNTIKTISAGVVCQLLIATPTRVSTSIVTFSCGIKLVKN